ncbi:hypothetical protein AbraIFM66950_006617 [Aspergillus brasiliensis]|nr:hypothetical protein AbraIFM66950_006617 [Aspergillus brasiliensis]
MNSVKEPSAWVCRLESFFSDGTGYSSGTGFLINILSSRWWSVVTAGHNLINHERTKAHTVNIVLPNGQRFTATDSQLFVAKAYYVAPTASASEPSSCYDYGLIAIKRPSGEPNGSGFNILIRDSKLQDEVITVYGYQEGAMEQTMHASRLDTLTPETLGYDKPTKGGLSGGPAMVFWGGEYIAVGIHNYKNRATRLTCSVMLEILGWVNDYPLRRVVKAHALKNEAGQAAIYLRATDGDSPNLVARPAQDAQAHLRFVLAVTSKAGANGSPLYVVLPAITVSKELKYLTFQGEGIPSRVSFSPEDPAARSRMAISITPQGQNGGDKLHVLHFSELPGIGKKSLLALPDPLVSSAQCEWGCIRPDEVVSVSGKRRRYKLLPLNNENDAGQHNSHMCTTWPPLYLAVMQGASQSAMALLHDARDVNFACQCRTTVLSKAAEQGNLKLVRRLLDKGANLNTENERGESPEMLAAREGHTLVLRRLQKHREENLEGFLAAAGKGSVERMKQHLAKGVDANARHKSLEYPSVYAGMSALELAASRGHERAVVFLLDEAKVDANAADAWGMTALQRAAEKGHTSVVRALLRRQADPRLVDHRQLTAFHHAAATGNVDTITALWEATPALDINARGLDGMTPLMMAACQGRVNAVRKIIGLSADVTLKNDKGWTALDLAQDRGHVEIERILALLPT